MTVTDKPMRKVILDEAEGENAAAASFRNALAIEEIHAQLYQDTLSKVKAGDDMPAVKIMVYPVCGNTVLGERPAF